MRLFFFSFLDQKGLERALVRYFGYWCAIFLPAPPLADASARSPLSRRRLPPLPLASAHSPFARRKLQDGVFPVLDGEHSKRKIDEAYAKNMRASSKVIHLLKKNLVQKSSEKVTEIDHPL